MIKVFGYAELGELADVSPFVAKVENYLRLAEVPYVKRLGDPRKAPRGKLPYIVHAGQTVPDSQRILDYLREQAVADLDDWLDPDQRAQLFMLRSMLELDFYFLGVYFRWQAEAGWAGYRGVIEGVMRKAGVPGLLVPLVLRSARKGAVAQVIAQGTGKRDADENLAHAREIVATLDRLLVGCEGPWWFGAKRSSADAIVHAFLGGGIASGMSGPLMGITDGHPRLREWFDHVHALVKNPARLN